ncbi:MAG: hypothetical protein IJP17_05140 [Clostridia bacterium]|nr:hypothetical protein [Clostridia bacterium]
MKKLIAIALAAIMLLSVTACGKDDSADDSAPSTTTDAAVTSAADVSSGDVSASDEPVHDINWSYGNLSLTYSSELTTGKESATLENSGAILMASYDPESPSAANFSVIKMTTEALLIQDIHDFDDNYGEISADSTLSGLSEFVGIDKEELELDYKGVTYQTFGTKEGAVIDYSIFFHFGDEGNSITFNYKSIVLIDGETAYTINFVVAEEPVETYFSDVIASVKISDQPSVNQI